MHAANPEVSPFPRGDVVEPSVASTSAVTTVTAVVPGNASGMPKTVTVVMEDDVVNYQYTSLPAIPSAMVYLTHVLDAESPSDGYERCVLPTNVSDYNSQFLMVMQATLVDFCGMNLFKQKSVYDLNHERTFWIESIIPMFKKFAGITTLVHFEW